jgi:F0F1-type ATP synthase gamma subunit
MISMRLKSVKNIQKITQSMKMVSAAKYTRAERELKQARPLGDGAKVTLANFLLSVVSLTSLLLISGLLRQGRGYCRGEQTSEVDCRHHI